MNDLTNITQEIFFTNLNPIVPQYGISRSHMKIHIGQYKIGQIRHTGKS